MKGIRPLKEIIAELEAHPDYEEWKKTPSKSSFWDGMNPAMRTPEGAREAGRKAAQHLMKSLPEMAKSNKIEKLQDELKVAVTKFKRLPNRGGFSALSLGERIEAIQQELDTLGDKSERFYPEVNISM